MNDFDEEGTTVDEERRLLSRGSHLLLFAMAETRNDVASSGESTQRGLGFDSLRSNDS